MSRIRYGVKPRLALGDSEPMPGSSLSSLSNQDVQSQMLATLQGVRQDLSDRLKREELQRWFQIAATVSIPIAAYIWRKILGPKIGI